MLKFLNPTYWCQLNLLSKLDKVNSTLSKTISLTGYSRHKTGLPYPVCSGRVGNSHSQIPENAHVSSIQWKVKWSYSTELFRYQFDAL